VSSRLARSRLARTRLSRTRLVRTLVVALALALPLAGASPAAADAGSEADFVARVNGARSSRGLGSLATDGELTGIARWWAQRMADDGRLSHNPNLSREVSQDWEKLAENVGFGGDVASIHDAFMNSAAHRANILDGALTHIGVGVVVDGSGQLWVTEVFMRLRGGGGAAPPTTATPPPTTARPAPVTTVRPAPAPTVPRPAPTAPPPTAAPTTTEAPPPPEPEPPAPPAPPPAPSPRLVLVLAGLHDLDRRS
jgi:hypothetical protein